MIRSAFDVVPLVIIPGPQVQVRWELPSQWVEEQEIPKLWTDHIASVNDFKKWKANHPNDGAMTVLYNWSPYILVTMGLITGNPLLLAGAYQSFCTIVDRWCNKTIKNAT